MFCYFCVTFLKPCPFRLPDGLTRRGDINLLMLGDPGTAKSQLLKFVERCSPIGVGVHTTLLYFLCFICRECKLLHPHFFICPLAYELNLVVCL